MSASDRRLHDFSRRPPSEMSVMQREQMIQAMSPDHWLWVGHRVVGGSSSRVVVVIGKEATVTTADTAAIRAVHS